MGYEGEEECMSRLVAQLGFNFREVFHYGAKEAEKEIKAEVKKLQYEIDRMEPCSILAERYQKEVKEVSVLKATLEFQAEEKEKEVKKLNYELENLAKERLELQVKALKSMKDTVE